MQPLLALVVTFGLMYVLLIRPQQRRMRQHQAVVASLRAGDEIVTAGGIYGTVVAVDDETMIVEVAPGVELRILRAAVSQRVTADEEVVELDDDDDDEVVAEGAEVADVTEVDEPQTEPGLSPGEENGRADRRDANAVDGLRAPNAVEGTVEPTKKDEEL